jgi:hypothetical protein
MNYPPVGWQIEAYRDSDELLEWELDLPPGTSYQVLERVLGIDDMSIPGGYPVTVEQVRAVLDYFDVPPETVGPLDDTRFAYFVGGFADTRTAQADPNPPGASSDE